MIHILKKAMVLVLSFVCVATVSAAKKAEFTIPTPEKVSLRHEGGYVFIEMDMFLKMIKISNNEAAIYTPVLRYGTHELKLKSVGVYGRTRYYQYIRSTGLITGDSEIAFIRGTQPAIYQYNEKISFRPWMENATLVLEEKLYECCQEIKAQSSIEMNARMTNPNQLSYNQSWDYPDSYYGQGCNYCNNHSGEGETCHPQHHPVSGGVSSGTTKENASAPYFDINVTSEDAEEKASQPGQEEFNSTETLLAALETPKTTTLTEEVTESSPYGSIVPQYLYYKVLPSKKSNISQKDTLLIQFDRRSSVLDPNYAENPEVLARLSESINQLKSNPNVTLNSITLTTYASPEGMINDNIKLVSQRVESIKNYLVNKGILTASMINTETVPESWDGLRQYVATHPISHRDAILRLIDGPREPDNKEWVLKSTYADVYKSLLNDVYPGLRYTIVDYDFDVKKDSNTAQDTRFVDANNRIIPVDDMFIMAQEYPEGSDQSQEIYLKAVQYYPSSFRANYNAAVALLQAGNPEEAKKYIAEAGETPDVYYTRGLIYMALRDYQTARDYMKLAYTKGVPQAEVLYEYLRNKVPASN